MIPVDLGAQALPLLIAAGAAWAYATVWVFRRWCNRAALRITINQIVAHVLEFQLFLDEPSLVLRAQRDLVRANLRLLRHIAVPSLILAIPLLLLLAQLDALYAHAPLTDREPAVLTVQLKSAAAMPEVHVQAPDGIVVETPPVRIAAAHQISWRLRPTRASSGELEILRDDRVVTKSIAAGRGLHRLNDDRAGIGAFLLHPVEPPLSDSAIASIHIEYPPATLLGVHWLVWFFGISTAAAIVILRHTLRMRTVIAMFLLSVCACAQTPEYTYKIVHVYPHDRTAFTQGLEYRDGFLYEGTGLKGHSSLRKVKLETGQVLQKIDLAPSYFGEGITVLGGRIVELTWQAQTGFVYDRVRFKLLHNFTYPGEGWGLTNDGKTIYMSDGSPQIRVWDPETLKERKRITVRDGNRPVENLNELECVGGEIYANVWQTNRIARIKPEDGRVIAWVDMSGLLKPEDLIETVDVLNGIAYDSAHDRLFVTGKLWPKLFEIKVVPKLFR